MKHISELIIQDQSGKSLSICLQAFKTGLNSKSEEIAQWTCKIFAKLAFELSDTKLLEEVWRWFTAENGGLFAFGNCIKTHSSIVLYILTALMQISRNNMTELFSFELKRVFTQPLEYLENLSLLLKPLTEMKHAQDEVNKFILPLSPKFYLKFFFEMIFSNNFVDFCEFDY